jgi:fructokinase
MIRIGFDIGGSKLAAIALNAGGCELARARQDVPRSYAAMLEAVCVVVADFEGAHGPAAAVGIAVPGMIGADSALIRVVNLPWLEGRPLRTDLAQTLGKPVTLANDANSFALSEAIDGAAAGAAVVFGAILGTGVGGGIVIEGKPIAGANAIPANGATTRCRESMPTTARRSPAAAAGPAVSRPG